LNFGVGLQSHVVQSVTDPNATSTNAVSGKLRCRVYAGGTASTNQIFPTNNKVAATTLMTTIDGGTNYSNLVFAIFEIDYDPENGLTGLGAINFDITNSLSEPSNVILDYLQNDRYGAGLSSTDIDFDSFDDLYDYSSELVAYTTNLGVGATHPRWRVDGMLSTFVDVKQNIDVLCQTCSAFFTYNPKKGKFAVVPNRAATTAEKNAAYDLNDDNLTGAITITSTDLYGLYNKMEVEYPSATKKDQTDTVFVTTPSGDRNPNEPENKLTTRYPLVNDNTRVENLANIDLRQSRTSQVVEVEADYEAISIDAGDVVSLTNTEYGFSNKYYRCMRTTEQESDSGMLNAKLVLLEYDDSVYGHSNVTQRGANPLSGIPGWWTDWSNATIDWGNITIVEDPGNLAANANIINSGNGTVIANVDYADIIIPDIPGGILGGPFAIMDIDLPANVYFDQLDVDVQAITDAGADTSAPSSITYTPPAGIGNPYFTPDTTTQIGIPLSGYGVNDFSTPNFTEFNATIRGKDNLTGVASNTSTTANIVVNPQNFIPKENLSTYTAGAQLEEADLSNLSVSNADAISQVIDPIEFDITGADIGTYSFQVAGTPIGATDTATVRKFLLQGNANVEYANSTVTVTDNTPITGSASEFSGPGRLPPRLDENTELVIDPALIGVPLNAADPLKPTAINFWVEGKNTLEQTPTGEVGFNDVKVQAIKITKNIR
jgi:hypothetical protein